ncbi:MAG: hemolysin family protein, partial [Candidatus Cloacimonetes bacterium]|nr:hemolysin family protein [Candidatus Cloacimonadota bacterium]
MNILILLLLLAIVVFFSWLFSGFELGLISQDRLKLEQEAKKNNLKKRILDLYDNNDKAFGTLLIGNSISTVTAAAIATYIFVNYLFDGLSYAEILSNFIITFLILFFCEILPKNLFRDFPNLVELFFPLINAFSIVLKPLVKVVTFINRILKKLFKIEENQSFSAFTKDDLSFILEETFNEGNIQQPQKEMLEDALEFNELIAKNVMKPRLEIVAIKDDMTIDQIIKVTKEEGYTRYPVYGEDLDDITGVLIIYDILKNDNSNQTAKELQRDALFVPETIDVSVLLKEMQMNKKSIAIVKDAYGGTAGLVTIEDILEEIVGEIDDEYDIDEVKD